MPPLMPNLPPNFRASPELMGSTPVEGALAPEPQYPEGYTFKDLQEKVKKLAEQFAGVKEKATKHRLLRNMEVDNEAERARGRFKQDEIYIPYHVIADNISKESSSYIKFVVGSRNAAIFRLRGSSQVVNNEGLERLFTSAVRYEGYEQELFGLIDGSQLHGLDYMEVVYDETKPGYFSFEHLGYENVWYPQKVQRGKFQVAPIVVRNCELTKDQVLKFPNVNVQQVEMIFKDCEKNNPDKEFMCFQKVFYRINEIVHVCWMCYEKSTDFLRAPQPLFMGRWKVLVDEMTGMEISRTKEYEKMYFMVPFPYCITENKSLIETLGRAQFDESTQEAVSSIVSSIVNGFNRASQIMGSPEDPTATGPMAALEMTIEGGRLYNKKVNWWSMPYPDAEGMNIVNALLTQNKSETAQMNLAVGNRSDYASRKTAKEIEVAEKKEGELTTTQVVLFSSAWREVLNMCWIIMKAQIEQGVIITDVPMKLLQQDLVLLTAGETEVVQRQETLANLQNLWPVISPTPAAMSVLEDILRLMVPQSADKYIAALRGAGGNDKAIIQALATLVAAIAKDHPEVIPPESYEELDSMLEAAQQSLSTQQPGQAVPPPMPEGGEKEEPEMAQS